MNGGMIKNLAILLIVKINKYLMIESDFKKI
jgi:hypothetical protein